MNFREVRKFGIAFFIFLFMTGLPATFIHAEETAKQTWEKEHPVKEPDQPLPIWKAPWEKDLPQEEWYDRAIRVMPPPSSRLTAEYEPVMAVVIGWSAYTSMLTEIAQASYAAGAEIWCAGSSAPSSITGIPPSHYYTITSCPINTVWIRDYGPFGILLDGGGPAIVDARYRRYTSRPQDDALPCCVAGAMSLSCYSINTAGSTGDQWLIMDGGNIMVTSTGELYMTNRSYNWNTHLTPAEVDQALMDYFGVHTVRTINYCGYPGTPADGTGHIDMIAKLLDDRNVLIANADGWTYDSTLEDAVTAFTGWGFTVHRVNCWYSGAWYTYTNSLIVNNHVLMPTYAGHTIDNANAVAAYESAMPGVTVHQINSDSSIRAGGAIHCITQTIPLELPDTPTVTPTLLSPTFTVTATYTATHTPTLTPTSTATYTPTQTRALTPTFTSTATMKPTQTPTATPTMTPTATPMVIPTTATTTIVLLLLLISIMMQSGIIRKNPGNS